MTFDLIGYTESQDSATLVNVAAIADPNQTVNGDNVRVPDKFNKIGAVYALGPNLTQIELQAPSLLKRLNPNFRPLDLAAEPSSPTPLTNMFDNPLSLKTGENLTALAAEDAAGASRATVMVFLVEGALAPIKGSEVITVRATGTTTLVANAWSNGTITLDDNLEEGTYALIGARGEAAGLQAFRFVFKGQSPRPGAIGYDAASDLENTIFRKGGLGEWGRFTQDNLPTVDYLSNSADTAETLWLDLQKVA